MGKVSGTPVLCAAGISGLAFCCVFLMTACAGGEAGLVPEGAQGSAAVSGARADNADGEGAANVDEAVGYPAGSYVVGGTLPAGEYVLEPDPSGRYAVFASAEESEPLDEGLFEGCAILTVSEGQRLELEHAQAVPFDEYPHELNPDRRAGMYKVGIDIPAGAYRAIAPGEDRGYWNITDTSAPDRKAIASSTFNGSDEFTVEDGQYLRINRCNIALAE
ncbi:hypothetical protein [Adlercreutzia caecimuris]|uniref:hypothetical protein n=1 Tax=Adlercreutzia caecimuris TaxID=671266 RepID=UPI002494F7AA|nr:hypothetical protein [Adlercreutzia caecimuris]